MTFWDEERSSALTVKVVEARKMAREEFKNGFFWKKFLRDRNQGKCADVGRQKQGFFFP